MFLKFFALIISLFPFFISAYSFKGIHYMAEYKECHWLEYEHYVLHAFKESVKMCGATIIDGTEFYFQGHGLTAVLLLSESHASIHTYPEHNAVFVDLFTCGEHTNWHQFELALKNFLEPKHITRKIIERS